MARQYKMSEYLEEIYCKVMNLDTAEIAPKRNTPEYQAVAKMQYDHCVLEGSIPLTESRVVECLAALKLRQKLAGDDDPGDSEPEPIVEQADEEPEIADEPVKRGPGRPKKADS